MVKRGVTWYKFYTECEMGYVACHVVQVLYKNQLDSDQ